MITDISHVRQVNHTLRNVSDWQSLGIELGLVYPTLESIRIDKHGVTSECKLAMIAAWLKQEDKSVRRPSWAELQAALREIGENRAADQLIGVSTISYKHDTL